MLTVALVLLLLHTLLFKAKPGVLCCGLFGGSFNQPITGKIIHRLKTLGLFNQQRGSDSCGIYNGDELIKGVDGNKKFYDFVVNIGVPANKGKNNVFIGHTRWATMGVHTAENAHPYNIDNKLIFAHNGKIENVWPLCRENDIDTGPLHVDSQGLGHLLAKVGQSILSEYKGYAAILAHDLSKPGTLFAYHGASREFKSELNPREERPLFFMETPEGIYFSSLKDPLLFIKEEDDKDPDVVPHNILFTFKDGKVIKQSKRIQRDDKNVYVYEPPKTVYTQQSSDTNSHVGRAWAGGKKYSSILSDKKEDDGYLNIHTEQIPKEFSENKVYYYRNRHWIGTNKCDGVVTVNAEGRVAEAEEVGKKTTLYFFRGIYLKSDKEYKHLHKQMQNPESDIMKTLSFDNRNFAKLLSKWSKYPITNIESESKDVDEEYRSKYYMNDKEVSAESIRPVYSERIYTYKEGRLKEVVATGGTPATEFFLKSASQKGSEGGNGAGKGASGAGTSNDKSQKEKDEKRRDLVSDICSRLRLDKITPNIEKTIALFDTKFDTVEQINLAMYGIGDAIMKLYAIDIMQSLCDMEKPRDSIIYDMIQDVYAQAAAEKVPLSELMEEGMEEVEYYIGEVMESWDFEDDEDVITVPAEVVEELEDLSYDPTAPIIKMPPFKAPVQKDIFKDFDKKKEVL